ncbi:MAG TPA: IPT/TIG domain-containing protein [Candidatus Polarisedimenticolia bacterium]|nr:IPT/TIG domain-containing protein [Candidatus Polarisedimenticolia bacterium]
MRCRIIVQLAAVPLGIGTITPTTVFATSAALTIRGSGFQSGATVTMNGKSASVTFKDANALLVVTPALNSGSQQIIITNPDGESVSLDAAFTAN